MLNIIHLHFFVKDIFRMGSFFSYGQHLLTQKKEAPPRISKLMRAKASF
jgi:hypothetical protein